VSITQETTGLTTLFLRGPVPLSFTLTIHNPSDVPVTLRRVELHSRGAGAYRLRGEAFGLDKTIPPGGTETLGLHAWARSSRGVLTETAPVNLVGTAVFDSPEGLEVRRFTAYLPQ
jgi:hypothetical protein